MGEEIRAVPSVNQVLVTLLRRNKGRQTEENAMIFTTVFLDMLQHNITNLQFRSINRHREREMSERSGSERPYFLEAEKLLLVDGGGLWRRLRARTPAPEVPELRLALGCSAALDRNTVRLFI